MIFIYITNPNIEEAKRISRYLLEKRLIACANIFPITSMYWWEGEIEEGEEVVLIAKTVESKYESVKNAVSEIHTYDIPCIAKLDVSINEQYSDWIRREVTG